MNVSIRRIETHQEYSAIEELQRLTWEIEDYREVIPALQLIAFQESGGLVLGAFLLEKGVEDLVGAVFGFLGRRADGQVMHYSERTGVLPSYQGRQIGYRLKCAQREHVLAQGIDHITWTYDPLESLNGRLNLHKLGAVCRTYRRDLYGARGGINRGLPTDRFWIDWHIGSAHVEKRLDAENGLPTLNDLLGQDVPLVNAVDDPADARAIEQTAEIEGERILIQIPVQFQLLKIAEAQAALAWRNLTRKLFESAFAQGYVATDMLYEKERGYYLLEKNWQPD